MERNAENPLQRDWHDLKPGDVVWFANGWFEVFDAYAVGPDTVKVKLIVDNAYTCQHALRLDPA
jgi:hypothetical protein